MDWSKAKNILIIIFIILNIFLLVYSCISREKSTVSKESVAAVIDILEKNNIIIDKACEIPMYKKNTAMLVFENSDINKQKIIEKLLGKDYAEGKDSVEYKDNGGDKDYAGDKDNGGEKGNRGLGGQDNQEDRKNKISKGEKKITFAEGFAFTYHNAKPDDDINIGQIKNTEKYLKEYFSGMGINMSRFILDRHIKHPDNNMDTYIFIEKYKNFLIYDNRISISIAQKGIVDIEVNIRKIKGFTKTASPVMPAHQALLKNFYKKKDIIIKSVDIGYKGFENEHGEQETKEIFHGPAWRIITADGTEVFLKAYDGEEIM